MWKPTPPPFRKFKKKQALNRLDSLGFIYQIGESPMLREKSTKVSIAEIKTLDFQSKIKYLKKCLSRYREKTGVGRGIAAVQIGIAQRFSAVYMPEIKGELMVIINPRVTKQANEKLVYPEMCMSANPAIAYVVRPSWIEFEYCDEKGIRQYWDRKAEDKLGMMYNRVFQHEIDHMDGIINIDLVQSKDIIFESDPAFYKNATFKKA